MNWSIRLTASKVLAGLVLLLVVQPGVSAQEPLREPVLRIETGKHTDTISRISVDAANRFLVTASHDKTARVWELPTGRLLRVLRVPIGAGPEGELYAAAISPDGMTIATGGWTGNEWDGSFYIYLFDRESGHLVRRVGGFSNVVKDLAYSLDGRYLAVMLGSDQGVRVYSTANYALAGEDGVYGDSSYNANFDHAGRLVTTASDGYVRLYAPPGSGSLRLLSKWKAADGQRPFEATFAPDGSRVAVGFVHSTKVIVLSGNDLVPLYAPDHSGFEDCDLGNVTWSIDGRTLYAGGTCADADNHKYIRAWADEGRGGYRDLISGARNTIMDMFTLSDGSIAYGTGGSTIGVIDEKGTQKLYIKGDLADYRDNKLGLLLSPDGAAFGFSYEQYGKSPAEFSLAERRLDSAPVSKDLRPPITENSNLRITDWNGSYTPKLNGHPLSLSFALREWSRSVAIAPDAGSFLLGTEWGLHLFDRQGKELWKVNMPSIAWAVNISGNGKLAVAAFSDGTIRWYDIRNGKELLAFFPHQDRQRWVMWTPSGYYDASPGAEDLIGWHVNHGRVAAADFFPAGQFRETFYRPDVIAKVLETGDEARALQAANEEAGRKEPQAKIALRLPPVIEIVTPSDNATVSSSEVTLRYRVRSPSGEPLTGVRALIDGRPAVQPRPLPAQPDAGADDIHEIKIRMPARDSEVSLIAENRFAASTPATISLKWREAAANAARAESSGGKPSLYILAIGVSNYADPKYNLKFAAKDAGDFANAMTGQKHLLYRDVIVKTLTNEQATKGEILKGIKWISKETTSNDVAMIYFGGHGVNDRSIYYFCPYDINPKNLTLTGIAFSDMRSNVSSIAGRIIFFVDTGHPGNSVGEGGRRGRLDLNLFINEMSSAENGVVVFSASSGSESSYERAEWNNGAFTKALVEGINGAVYLSGKGSATYSMLNSYISSRVKELTEGRQRPTMISPQTVPDSPIAVKR